MSKFYTNVSQLKGKICVRAIEDGRRISFKTSYHPYLFLPAIGKKTEYKTIDGKPVAKMDFENSWEQREFIKKYENVENFEYYGMAMPVYTYINDNSPEVLSYDPTQIRIIDLDIEVDTKDGFPDVNSTTKEITVIGLRSRGRNLVFGCGQYKTKDKNTEYVKCIDEKEMLKTFLTAWNDETFWQPDIVTGWNVNGFDIPYLVRRIEMILGEDWAKMMSPWRSYSFREFKAGFGHTQIEYNLLGIDILDYMALYKKFSYTPQESYKLDHIANYELKEGKRDYSKYKSIQEFYEKDFQGFVDYNIQDNVLVDKLEEKKGFIKLVMAMAYDAKINFKDCFTPTRVWDVIIHNYLMRQGIVIPKQKHPDGGGIEGAYVKEPILGMHKWVVSFDLNSLYPHLIQMYNISPETLVGSVDRISIDDVLNGELNDDKYKQYYDKGYTIATPGHIFTKEKLGFYPAIMKKMYDDRVVWKNRMIEAKKKYEKAKSKELENEIDYCKNMQHQLKITLNSGYGVMCNQYFRWFDTRLGESVTLSGQVSIRWMEKRMNDFLNKRNKTVGYDYIIACDTDSMYLRLDNEIEPLRLRFDLTDFSNESIVDRLDDICEQVYTPFIAKCYKELAEYTHAYSQTMVMKRETIANKGIWTAAKHYALNAYDIEGVRYKEPELKITGLECVRSSTPSACRVSIKDAIRVIMNKEQTDLIKYIEDFKIKHKTLPIAEIAFPRSVNGLTKYIDSAMIYKKGTPIQVKGSLLFNKFLRENDLTKEYQLITDSEKIKFVYLKMPNPIKDKVISFIGEPPKELGIEKYVDHDIMFEKSFVEPLKGILDAIGWQSEHKDTLEDFLV